jgi:hypothetical protein|tara:strand:+ start:971 stop:1675 length:705 start_codon:yes stop_codon:yes gene_type:complete
MLPKLATPKYDMIVPSTGKPITYRPYVVREEKILLIAMESQDEKQIENAVLNIIRECVESPIDIDLLTTFDVEFMFVTLRSKSVGEGIKLGPSCTHCDEENEVKVNLDEVTVANLGKEVDTHIKLTDDISLDLKWTTMKDRAEELTSGTETETIINLMMASVETIYSGEEIHTVKDVPKEEVREFIESLNTDQFESIVNVLAKAPYLSYNVNYNCKKCKKENTIELKGLIDFFQ